MQNTLSASFRANSYRCPRCGTQWAPHTDVQGAPEFVTQRYVCEACGMVIHAQLRLSCIFVNGKQASSDAGEHNDG